MVEDLRTRLGAHLKENWRENRRGHKTNPSALSYSVNLRAWKGKAPDFPTELGRKVAKEMKFGKRKAHHNVKDRVDIDDFTIIFHLDNVERKVILPSN